MHSISLLLVTKQFIKLHSLLNKENVILVWLFITVMTSSYYIYIYNNCLCSL